MFGARHLREDRLLDCYTAERSGEPLDPPAAEHLADCPECAGRYAELARFMDDVRLDVDAEIDEVFPSERLRVQQQQIAYRLEHLGHLARVISFPGQAVHQMRSRASRIAPRWIMGAAAAGLVIGVGVGTFYDSFDSRLRSDRSRVGAVGAVNDAQPAPQAPAAVQIVRPSVLSTDADPAADAADVADVYDEFLAELELAGDQPHYYAELVALDELTPHVRPIRTGLR